jgi:3-phosphoshikimate 1-carboxyvinyltransferase
MKDFKVTRLNLIGKSFAVTVPASKSMANRALILASLRKGKTTLKGDFAAEDIQIMVNALRKIGITIVESSLGLRITNDLSWRRNPQPLKLDIGNSGTSIRFLTSLVCLRNGSTILTGKPRMMQRPIGDLVDALRQMGAEIQYLGEDGFPPLKVIGHGGLRGGRVLVKADTSSQFLTSLLLVGSQCEQKLVLKVPGKAISQPYIAMTKSMIKHFDTQRNFQIEGDASAAVYWWALAFLQGAKVTVTNLPKRSLQGDAKFLRVLSSLKGTRERTIDMNDMPDASMMLMAMAPLLAFPIRITNIASLRVKETDRIAAMATELTKLGVKLKTGKDWIKIWPAIRESSTITKIHTYDDHRVAMSMAILGTVLGNLEILDPDCVNKTYPEFWKELLHRC